MALAREVNESKISQQPVYETLSPSIIYAFLRLYFEAPLGAPQMNVRWPAKKKCTQFHAVRPASISVGDYFIRIFERMDLPIEAMIIGLAFIVRQVKNGVPFDQLTAHRLLAASLVVADKLYCDRLDKDVIKNKDLAPALGMRAAEVSILECSLLMDLNWDIIISPEEYLQVRQGLLEYTEHYKKRLPALELTFFERTKDGQLDRLMKPVEVEIKESKHIQPSGHFKLAGETFFNSILRRCGQKRKSTGESISSLAKRFKGQAQP